VSADAKATKYDFFEEDEVLEAYFREHSAEAAVLAEEAFEAQAKVVLYDGA
jgi:hypothetical protein